MTTNLTHPQRLFDHLISERSSYTLEEWLKSLPPSPSCSDFPALVDDLNTAQAAAVDYSGGPLLVIAGAGTGKTRTLVYRVANLIDQGADPGEILLLTFTNKSAEEMLCRAKELRPSAVRVKGGTFHSTANFFLRRFGAKYLGFDSNFTVIDQADAEGIIRLLSASLRLSGSGRRFPNARTVFSLISASVNKNFSIDSVVVQSHPDLVQFVDDFYVILEHYSSWKKQHNLLDFDDLLLDFYRLLLEYPAARSEIQQQIKHVLVDEYQDTNYLQSMIVYALATGVGNVTVVGDDAQGIYSFRGAEAENILTFPSDYPLTKIVKLEENYRSTPEILTFSNAILESMSRKYDKKLYSSLPSGAVKPSLYIAESELEEARWVVLKIKQLISEGVPAAEIAVLYRSSNHAYKLELALGAAVLNYEKWGGLKVTESAHVKDILCLFRVLVNLKDGIAWNRLLLHIPGLGPKTAERMLEYILWHSEHIDFFGRLRILPSKVKVSAKVLEGWTALINALEAMNACCGGEVSNLGRVYDVAIEYYNPIFERIYYEDHPTRYRDLVRIRSLMVGYNDLAKFLADCSLGGVDVQPDRGLSVTLSTIHSAKGKEWRFVFVIGLADHRFPAKGKEHPDYEEERRLFYVACTRAKEALYLTWPKSIVTLDQKRKQVPLSAFVSGVDPFFYTVEKR